jgi:hypothetical protein
VPEQSKNEIESSGKQSTDLNFCLFFPKRKPDNLHKLFKGMPTQISGAMVNR